MGRDKRTLQVGGKSLFDRGLGILEGLFSEVLVVVAETGAVVDHLNSRVVTDLVPDRGSAGGLYTGIFYASNSHVFTVACDMPFLEPRVVQHICEMGLLSDVTMVQLSTGLQPMQGVYSKRCLPVLEEMVKTKCLRIQDLMLRKDLAVQTLEEESMRKLDPHLLSFLNVNTPADLEFATKLCRN